MSSPTTRLAPPLLAALAALCAAGLDSCGPPESGVQKVILFTVDTLRADQLGAQGNRTYPTPNLDRLAERSLVFDRAYSPATLTVPALSSMLTGLTTFKHGVHAQRGALARGVVPLPFALQSQGVQTASFIANICVLQPEPRSVFHDGWDVQMCGMDDEVEQYRWDEEVVSAAMAWLEEAEGPYLCWVHLMDPHAEHRPNPADWDYGARPVLEKFEQYEAFNAWEMERSFPEEPEYRELWDLYAAEVSGVDRQLGRFLDFLDARPDREEIALIFSADHGEELYETWSRYDHGLSLTEGVTWVPLMIDAPGVEPGLFADPVELLQVTPTVLDLMEQPVPYPLDGPSLLSEAPSRGYAISSVGDVAISLRTPEHRFYWRKGNEPYERQDAPWRADAPWFIDKLSLGVYDGASPTEVRWLDVTDPAVAPLVQQYDQELRAYRRNLGKLPSLEAIEDENIRKSLADQGYLGYDDLTGEEGGE